MPYKIAEFDGLTLFDYLERGDTQSLGVGRAVTDFVQMPGGGHFDNYGDEDSPRELTPISKQGVIYSTGGLTVREQVDALRAKLGKRARLEMLWHDGVTRWTWARLTGVDSTRPFNARLLHIPVTLTWMPAEGVWYAEEEVEEETVFATTTTAEDISITNPGNVNVTDAIIEYVSPVNSALTITFENYATSQKVEIEVLAIDVDETIILNVGNRTARHHFVPVTITTIARSGNVITVDCGSAHGLVAGDDVVIRGTDYDGFYEVASAPDTDTITIAADPLVKQPHGPESPVAGLLAKTDDLFGNCTFSDEAEWFWLVPGAQTIHLTASDDMDGGTFRVTYNPTYA